MQGNIYWYSWPIFPPHQVSVHADTQQPEIPPPTFLWLHRAPRKQPTEMGCTSLYYIRAKTTRALTTATQPRRKVFRDVPHSLPCLSWIQALCAAKRDGHCYHTNMPTFMHQRKYFTLASCSPHDYSTRFPPLTHNHNEPHWLFYLKSAGCWLCKNPEGRTAANSKKRGDLKKKKKKRWKNTKNGEERRHCGRFIACE